LPFGRINEGGDDGLSIQPGGSAEGEMSGGAAIAVGLGFIDSLIVLETAAAVRHFKAYTGVLYDVGAFVGDGDNEGIGQGLMQSAALVVAGIDAEFVADVGCGAGVKDNFVVVADHSGAHLVVTDTGPLAELEGGLRLAVGIGLDECSTALLIATGIELAGALYDAVNNIGIGQWLVVVVHDL